MQDKYVEMAVLVDDLEGIEHDLRKLNGDKRDKKHELIKNVMELGLVHCLTVNVAMLKRELK